jgi:hypothetical protein
MKTQDIYSMVITTMLLYSFLTITATQRDNCKEMGDSCGCAIVNSKKVLPGFCLPGLESKPANQLYCDCTSDVLSEDEVITLMIQKYSASDRTGGLIRQYVKKWFPQSYAILESIYAQVGANAAKLTTVNIAKLRNDLTEMMRKEKIAWAFFAVSDECAYVGKDCDCSKERRKGVCTVTRNRPGELRCHCE